MSELTGENTNAVAHRIAGDSLVYDCPACEYGEIPVAGLVADGSARCLDCGRRYRCYVEPVASQ